MLKVSRFVRDVAVSLVAMGFMVLVVGLLAAVWAMALGHDGLFRLVPFAAAIGTSCFAGGIGAALLSSYLDFRCESRRQ